MPVWRQPSEFCWYCCNAYCALKRLQLMNEENLDQQCIKQGPHFHKQVGLGILINNESTLVASCTAWDIWTTWCCCCSRCSCPAPSFDGSGNRSSRGTSRTCRSRAASRWTWPTATRAFLKPSGPDPSYFLVPSIVGPWVFSSRLCSILLSIPQVALPSTWDLPICVTRAPLLYFIRSWVALSFKVVSQCSESVRQASVTPVQISTFCNI